MTLEQQESLFRDLLYEAKIDEGVIDQIFEKLYATNQPDEGVANDDLEKQIDDLQIKIHDETDWRKKVVLAAQRVKLGLDRA